MANINLIPSISFFGTLYFFGFGPSKEDESSGSGLSESEDGTDEDQVGAITGGVYNSVRGILNSF